MKHSCFDTDYFCRAIGQKLFAEIKYKCSEIKNLSLQDAIWLYKNSYFLNRKLESDLYNLIYLKIMKNCKLNDPKNSFEDKVFNLAENLIFQNNDNKYCKSKLDTKYSLLLSRSPSYVKVQSSEWEEYNNQIILNLKESWNEKESV